MNKLAIIVTRGTHNSLVTVFTLVMAAAVSEISVRVFFRDEAVFSLKQSQIKKVPLSDVFKETETEIRKNLQKAKLDDLQRLMKEVKSQGDVKFSVCTSSMAICGVKQDDLVPEIDEARGLTSFLLEEMSEADQVLSF
ncbi:MAG TPA: DsrE family protein [Nitrospiria bacterium]|jgi:peroxiredoxin family protein